MATIRVANLDNQEMGVMDGSLLRTKLLENNVDVYKFVAKLTNCGGVGQCGTCVVEVVEGSENLSGRTAAEERHLKKKPGSYRLACQTKVLQGTVVLNVKPK